MKYLPSLPMLAWGLLAAVIFVTVCPIGLRPPTEITVNTDRALAFGLLGGLFALAYPARWLWLLALIPLGAFCIEALQFLSSSRHPHFDDAAFKAFGAFAGIVLGRVLSSVLPVPAPDTRAP